MSFFRQIPQTAADILLLFPHPFLLRNPTTTVLQCILPQQHLCVFVFRLVDYILCCLNSAMAGWWSDLSGYLAEARAIYSALLVIDATAVLSRTTRNSCDAMRDRPTRCQLRPKLD